MITTVALFDLREPKRENAEAVAQKLRAMRGVVAGLDALEVGVDVNRGPRAADVCLITRHADRAALEAYRADPTHAEVKAFIAERAGEGATVVDFVSAGDAEP
jgi:hypothetical protein